MYKVIIFVAIYIAASNGAPGSQGTCGERPSNLFRCLRAPILVGDEASQKCKSSSTECVKINCLFRESKWMDGDVVDKVKFSAFLDEFAKHNPEWSASVEHAKTECLGEKLLPQGVDLNCPTFDITHCVYTSFIRYSPSSRWSSEESCSNALEYARSCPVCPKDCISATIPIGSCNACFRRPT